MLNRHIRDLNRGQRYPYHQNPDANVPYTEIKSAAEYAALGVLADLSDRYGIKQELNDLDYDIRCELVESLTNIIEAAIDNFDKLENKSLGIENGIPLD